MRRLLRHALTMAAALGACSCAAQTREQPANASAAPLAVVDVDAQPLAANIQRVLAALDSLGAPLSASLRTELLAAGQGRDARKLQALIDPQVLLAVHINPEVRVKVARGPAPAVVAASRIHRRARQGHERKPRHAAAAYRQSAVGARLRRHVEALGRADAAAASARERERRAAHRSLPRRGDVHRGADDDEPERTGCRVCGGADLFERGRTARSHDHVRRRPGDAGSWISCRGAGAVHDEAGGSREADGARPRWDADDGAAAVRRSAGSCLSTAGEAAGAGSVLPETHLSRGRRDRAAAAGRVDDVLRPRARISMAPAHRHDRGA